MNRAVSYFKISAKFNLSSLAAHPRLARGTVEINLTICEVMLCSRGCVAIGLIAPNGVRECVRKKSLCNIDRITADT